MRGRQQFGCSPQANLPFPLYPQSQQHIIIPLFFNRKSERSKHQDNNLSVDTSSTYKIRTALNVDTPPHDSEMKSKYGRKSGSTNKRKREEKNKMRCFSMKFWIYISMWEFKYNKKWRLSYQNVSLVPSSRRSKKILDARSPSFRIYHQGPISPRKSYLFLWD